MKRIFSIGGLGNWKPKWCFSFLKWQRDEIQRVGGVVDYWPDGENEIMKTIDVLLDWLNVLG